MIDIKAVGICPSGLAIASGVFRTQFSAVLGHEGAGIVAAVGAGITRVAVGDKVLLTFDQATRRRRLGIACRS